MVQTAGVREIKKSMNHKISTTVWGEAIRLGWSDVCERCLELGASARMELKYWLRSDLYADAEDLCDKGTPKDLVLKNKGLELWERNRLLKLLRKYSND